MQLLSLIPFLILLLYLLVSIDLVYIGRCELVLEVYPEGEQLFSKFYSNCSGAETTSKQFFKFSMYTKLERYNRYIDSYIWLVLKNGLVFYLSSEVFCSLWLSFPSSRLIIEG